MSEHKNHRVTMYDASNILVLQDRTPTEVAEAMIRSGYQEEPFFIFDFDTAYSYVKRFRTKMPRIQIFYAMKCNDYSMMIKIAIALGLGFDCATPGEIYKIIKHNVSPMSIIYAMPIKAPEQMQYARKCGVRHTTFDSPGELGRLTKFWPDARLLVRVRLESDSVYKLGDKFGCELNEATALLDEAARLNMSVVGVTFHVGSGCFSKESYSTGLRMARALFDYEASNGRKMTIVDIGGGFFCNNTDKFDQIADLINEGIEKLFPSPDVQIVAEPGRFLCESAFTQYSNIKDIRTGSISNKRLNMVYLNNGINGSLRSIESWHTMNIFKPCDDTEDEEIQDTIIWGPTPNDEDVLRPLKMARCSTKDWLVFCQHGAYANVFSTRFCSPMLKYTRSVMSIELWNKVKNHPIFASDVFVMDTGLAPCLPSALPPLLVDNGKYAHSHTSTIIE